MKKVIMIFVKGVVALVQSIVKAEQQWAEFDRWLDRGMEEEKESMKVKKG